MMRASIFAAAAILCLSTCATSKDVAARQSLEKALRSCDLDGVTRELASGRKLGSVDPRTNLLMLAARCPDMAIAKAVLRLTVLSARPDPQALAGALGTAVYARRPDLVAFLLDRGADPSSPDEHVLAEFPVPVARGTQYKTLLHGAIEQARPQQSTREIVDVLIRAGAR